MSTIFTLAIESSTYLASVALFESGESEALAQDAVKSRGAGEERLLPAIDAMLRGVGVEVRELGEIICGAGPGSFTSLRVGASLAKGLARGTGAALSAVPSLPLIVHGGAEPRAPGAYLAVVDAMRGERFVQGIEVGSDRRLTLRSAVERISVADLPARASALGATTIGPGEGVAVAAHPHARGVLRVADLIVRVDLDRWEPDYGRLAEAQVKWEATHGRPLGPP